MKARILTLLALLGLVQEQVPVTAQSRLGWCSGNLLTVKSANNISTTLVGGTSAVLGLVAVGTEFKALAQFSEQNPNDLVIYSMDDASTPRTPNQVFPISSIPFSGGVTSFRRPRLAYDGVNLMIISVEVNASSIIHNHIVYRIVSGASLQAPKSIVSSYDTTSASMDGFVVYSPSNVNSQMIYIAYLRLGVLEFKYFDRSINAWLSSTFVPSAPAVTGGVTVTAGPYQVMVCANANGQLLCYTGAASGFNGVLTKVSTNPPLLPRVTISPVFSASCIDGHYMVGTATEFGVSVVSTLDRGTTWGDIRDVPQVIATVRSELVGFNNGGQCKYSFMSRNTSIHTIFTISTDSYMRFPSENIETIFRNESDYTQVRFVANATKTMIVGTRSTGFETPTVQVAGCTTVPTSSPTRTPTKAPTTSKPTKK